MLLDIRTETRPVIAGDPGLVAALAAWPTIGPDSTLNWTFAVYVRADLLDDQRAINPDVAQAIADRVERLLTTGTASDTWRERPDHGYEMVLRYQEAPCSPL